MTVRIDFSGSDRVGQILDSLNQKIDQMERGFRGVAESSRNISGEMQTALDGMLRRWISIEGAINLASNALQTYERNMSEAARSTESLVDATTAFLNVQPEGTGQARVGQVLQVGRDIGVTDQRQLFNVVQAIQSARGGDFQAGLDAARAVFTAGRLGVGTEAGLQAEQIGVGVGAAPGQVLREFFVAGLASPQSPAELIQGARGLRGFGANETAIAAAVATVLSTQFFGGELGTFTRQAGSALAGGGAIDTFLQSRGIQADTREERILALQGLGISELADVEALGVTEERQAQAILVLSQNIEMFTSALQQIQQEARPGLLGGRLSALEEDNAMQRMLSESNRERAMLQQMQQTPEAMEQANVRRTFARMLREQGQESFLGFDLITAEGDLTAIGNIARLFSDPFGQGVDIARQIARRGIAEGIEQQTEVATPER